MRTYHIAQGTLLYDLRWPKWEGNLKRVYICIHITDSLCCMAEINIVKQLYSNKKYNQQGPTV